MTTLNLANIPDGVNTVEKAHAWSALALMNMFPDVTALEVAGQVDRAVIAQVWPITAGSSLQYRLITRTSLIVSPNWLRGSKLWTHVQELGSTNLPSEFTTN